jgi:hypothetical protein
MVQKFKKRGNSAVVTLLGIAVLGGGYLLLTNNNVNLAPASVSNDISEDNNPIYLDSITGYNTSVFTVTESGSGKDKKFIIEVDKDNIASATDYTFTTSFKQYLKDGVTLDANSVQPHTLYVAPRQDIVMHNSNNDEFVIIDSSASTIDGSKSSVQKTFTAVNPVSVDAVLSFNPQSVNLALMVEVDEIGEKEEYTLDFGQMNPVILKIKN